jgi:hypothetical protein
MVDLLLSHGADINKTNEGMTALQNAVLRGNVDLVRHLLSCGARVTDFENSPLLLSVVANPRKDSQGMVDVLLKAGANPYSKPGGSMSAVEFLAEKRDIAGLRLLDTKGRQAALLAEYTPPKDSSFIGVWSNEKGEFQTVYIILNEEGLGLFGIAISPVGWFPWRITGPKRAELEMRIEKETHIMTFTLNDDGTLDLEAAAGRAPIRLKRQKEKALTLAEYAEKNKK